MNLLANVASSLGLGAAGTAGGANVAGTLTTTTTNTNVPSGWYPVQQEIFNSVPVAPRYNSHVFNVHKIDNGFLLMSAQYQGAMFSEYFCNNEKEIGERVTALLVKYMLEETK